jgi:hypothetical protein
MLCGPDPRGLAFVSAARDFRMADAKACILVFFLLAFFLALFLLSFLLHFCVVPPSNFRISGPSSYPSVRRPFHGKPRINMRRLKDFADIGCMRRICFAAGLSAIQSAKHLRRRDKIREDERARFTPRRIAADNIPFQAGWL